MAKPGPKKTPARPIFPMELQVGDHLIDPRGDWEIAGRPYTTNQGKTVHVRVRRVDDPGIGAIRSWPAHERIAVQR